MKNLKEYIKIHWSYRDIIKPEKYPEIACNAIINGEDHPAILELAALYKPEMYEIDDILNRYKDDFLISKNKAMDYLTKEIALKIVNGTISPYQGALEIFDFYNDNGNPEELIEFYQLKYCYEEDPDLDRKKGYEKMIIEEAKKLVKFQNDEGLIT